MIWDTRYMPDSREIHCSRLAKAFLVSADHLESNKTILDNLNVFPVPDGDTGSNMAGSFVPGVQLLSDKKITSCTQIADTLLPYLNDNSRGNSGFILSRFFNGFFSAADSRLNEENLTVRQIADGFSRGFYEVNFSLFNPLAGTMVTIIEAMAESLNRAADYTVIQGLELAIKEARTALFETPKMLPVLAQAGVIDSGALGFILIIEGLFFGLTGAEPPMELEHKYRFAPDPNAVDSGVITGATRYCTELTVAKTGPAPGVQLQEFLKLMGSSIAFVDDPHQIKLHIHTNEPEQIMEELAKYGNISRKKVEDMYLQIISADISESSSSENTLLVFSPGPGFNDVFRNLGVENIIEYSNILPSAGEIGLILNRIDIRNIIILPNNSNILPSCMAAREKSDKNIAIIPSANIVQGLTAVYGFSENEDLRTNIAAMKECLDMATGMYMFRSSGSRVFGKTVLEKDDYFILHNDTLCSVDQSYAAALKTAVAGFDLSEIGNITLFYKNEDFIDRLNEVRKELNSSHPDLEIEILFGGQSQAELIIVLE